MTDTRRLEIQRVDHAGFNVRDLDAAVAFLTDVLGFELVRRTDAGVTQAPRRAMLSHRNDLRVELLEHPGAAVGPPPPPRDDPNHRHLALAVDDVHAAGAALAEHPEAHAAGEIVTVDDGTTLGYFDLDFGLTVELIKPV